MRHLILSLLILTACPARALPFGGDTCATEHHQGGPATLELDGGDLLAASLPRGQWALLVRSPFLAPQPAPFGEGFLCLHNLHLSRVQATSTGTGAVTFAGPHPEGYYQVTFRDCDRWEPAADCDSLRYNTTNVELAANVALGSQPVGLSEWNFPFYGFFCMDVGYSPEYCEECYEYEEKSWFQQSVSVITDQSVLSRFVNGQALEPLELNWHKVYSWWTVQSPPCNQDSYDGCGIAFGNGNVLFRFVTDQNVVVDRQMQSQLHPGGAWADGFQGSPQSNLDVWQGARVRGVRNGTVLDRLEIYYTYWAHDAYGFSSTSPGCTLDVSFWTRQHRLEVRLPAPGGGQ